MSLKLAKLSNNIESSDNFHLARLLILVKACSGKKNKPVDGIMKLAKLDFLLRYPSCLVRVLNHLGKDTLSSQIDETERNTIEAKMIRFRYGPWDTRYRRWLGLLMAKGLLNTYVQGKTIKVKLTDRGASLADSLSKLDEFEAIHKRSKYISTAVGNYSATKLKNFIYEIFPELTTMKWGKNIEL